MVTVVGEAEVGDAIGGGGGELTARGSTNRGGGSDHGEGYGKGKGKLWRWRGSRAG